MIAAYLVDTINEESAKRQINMKQMEAIMGLKKRLFFLWKYQNVVIQPRRATTATGSNRRLGIPTKKYRIILYVASYQT